MYAHVVSLGVTGLDGYPVTVETHISGGLPKFAMVGLPDSAVKESSERVRSAIKKPELPLARQPCYRQPGPRRCAQDRQFV